MMDFERAWTLFADAMCLMVFVIFVVFLVQ